MFAASKEPMKVATILLFSIIFASVSVVSAQRNVTPAIERDPVLEKDAKHNLDVAWQAFAPLKRAYKQVVFRFEETYAAYPDFSKMDEFLYLAGMASYYLSKNEGRQKVDLTLPKEKTKFAPEKLREDAEAYLAKMIELNPSSQYKEQAEKTLAELKAAK